MNMMASSADGVADFRPENLGPDVRRLVCPSEDFDRIGLLPALDSITCSFRAIIDWIGDEGVEQTFG